MAKCCGSSQTLILPARLARSAGCPISSSRSSMSTYVGVSATANMRSTSHDRCRYTPSMWYFLAPNACPHSVSSALAMPSRKPKLKPATTVEAMEKAASSRSPMWPMNACETTLIPYSAIRWKMAGPTTRHSFFDSTHHSPATLAPAGHSCCFTASASTPPRGRSSGAATDVASSSMTNTTYSPANYSLRTW
ncbi:Os08g0480050, partial [Oryza sativa Japonica Group]